MTSVQSVQPGQVVTFYSYKGGTGRSMMLANIAWILASNGRRVLMIDWDLEAPGLHRYLHPFLVDPELRSTQGLIDLVTQYSTRAITPAAGETPSDRPWYDDLADLTGYVFSIANTSFDHGGTIDFLPAGRQGPAYASRVTSFDWPSFYGRLGGGAFLDEVGRRARQRYDYVLIDSRTGVSDTSGICTVQLPDTLVVCFTLNRQSIEGAAAIAESATSQRRALRVLPVPCRVELGEKERLDGARDYAYGRFAALLGGMTERQRDDYWASVEVLYQPFYAYEEVLAPFADRPRQPTYVLASAERLAGRITEGTIERLVPPPERVRTEMLARYMRKPLVEPNDETRHLRDELERRDAAAQATSLELSAVKRRNRRLAVVAGITAAAALAVVGWAVFLRGSKDTRLSVSPDPVEFGDVAVGGTGEVTMTVSSSSQEPIAMGVTMENDAGGVFVIEEDDCGDELAAGSSCWVRLAFYPTEVGAASGDLHVSDFTTGYMFHIDLVGDGVAEE